MIKPLNDYLLIDPIIPSKVVGGLQVQSQEMGKPILGFVLAIGPGKLNEAGVLVPVPTEIAVGSKVGFTPGTLVGKLWRDEDGNKHAAFMLKHEHVLGIDIA